MEKKLISLYVPAAQEKFDVFVPIDVEIATLTELMADGVDELCGGRYNRSREEMLTQKNPDMLLRPEKTLADYGIEDGEELVLF